MENTLELNTPTQTLHLAVDIEIQNQTKFNQQSIEKAIKLLLQNHSQAFCSHSAEQILLNLGIKDESKSLETSSQSRISLPNEWEQMLRRLKQPPMTSEQRKNFDESRKEFRENFLMRDASNHD